MSRTIWKFPLPLNAGNHIQVPKDAKPLAVQIQYGIPTIWFLIDASDKPIINETWEISMYGTGHPVISKYDDYVSTIQMEDGKLIFHVFARNMGSQHIHPMAGD